MRHRLLASFLLLFSPVIWAMDNLTGEWRGNDGGYYYLRQEGERLYWYGEQRAEDPDWSTVFIGRVSDYRIEGYFLDVPKGQTRREGSLVLSIEENGNVLILMRKTGGLSASRWERMQSDHGNGTIAADHANAPRAECQDFNPGELGLQEVEAGTLLVAGDEVLLGPGTQNHVDLALRAMQHYAANELCHVGAREAAFSYFLIDGTAPAGRLAGEHCQPFDPALLRVRKIGGNWLLQADTHTLYDFGGSRRDARQAQRIIKYYGFERSCDVGDATAFRYLRR